MAEEKTDQIQEQEESTPLSLLEKKRKGLLDELDEHLEKVGDNYGPILLEELQNRLEFIVKSFHEEVETLFKESFKKWQVKDTQLRDLLQGEINLPETGETQPEDESDESDTPEFIKGVEFGPVRPK